jgi:restriction endonuclease S subunit
LSNNSYYLEVTDNNFLLEYVYYWLKFNKTNLFELSNLTSQTNLNKTNLLSYNIPIIDLTIQKNIILYAETFYNLIDKHNLELVTIKETDIMNIINSIHKL